MLITTYNKSKTIEIRDIIYNELKNKYILAVVFDLFGTIGNWSNKCLSNPAQVLLHYASNLNEQKITEIVRLIEGVDGAVQFSAPIDVDLYKKLEEKRWVEAAKIAGVFLDENIIRLMRLVIQRRKLELYDDTLPTLKMLHKFRIPWVLCSNASLDVPKKINFIIPTEIGPASAIFSCEVGVRKPNQKIYSFITEHLNVPRHNILFIGDRISCDYLGPRLFGFNAVLLQRSNFSISPDQEIELKKVELEHRWTSLRTLHELILEQYAHV